MRIRIDVEPEITDNRWRAAVEAAFARCSVPREGLYAVRAQLTEYLGGVTATLFTAGAQGEIFIGGELPFGETPDELLRAVCHRLAAGLDG